MSNYFIIYSSSEDEAIRNLTAPKQSKSLIAKLAESRKAQKSIFCYGPIASTSTSPVKTVVPVAASYSGTPDLLGSILESQSQLRNTTVKKEPVVPKPRTNNRLLGAILASQASLNLLDQQPVKSCSDRQSESIKSQTSQESSSAPSTSQNCIQPTTSTVSNGSTAGGSGEDPDQGGNKRNKTEPGDKMDEEDVDLYSDIESVEGEEKSDLPPAIQEVS